MFQSKWLPGCKLSNDSLINTCVTAMLTLRNLPVSMVSWYDVILRPATDINQRTYAEVMHRLCILATSMSTVYYGIPLSWHRYPLCACAEAMHWPGTTPLTTGYVWRNHSNSYRYRYTFIILTKYVTYVRLVATILFQSTRLMCVHGLWLGFRFINVPRVWNSYDVILLRV